MAKLVNKQFNSPIGLYSEQNIRDVIERDSQILANGAVGVNFSNPTVGKPTNLQNSAVLRMLEEEEQRQRSGQAPNLGNSGSLRENITWPPPEYDQRNLHRATFKDVVIPGLKRVAWPPPNEGEVSSEQPPVQSQGGPQYPAQAPPNHAPAKHQPAEQPPHYQQPLQPLVISNGHQQQPSPHSPLANQSPAGFRPATPSTRWAPVHSPGGHSPQPQFPSPQYQTQPQPHASQPRYQSPQPQAGQRVHNIPIVQSPPEQYGQFQSPQPQYQSPQPQYQSPQPQPHTGPRVYNIPIVQSPLEQYQAPHGKYQAPQPQYQAAQPQYQSPQPQAGPRVYNIPIVQSPPVSALPQQFQPQYQSPPAQQQYQAPTQSVAAPVQPAYQPQQRPVEPPPTTITLRPQAPVSQAPPPLVTSQPATATFKGGKNLRGDMKWPPEEVKSQMEEENRQRVELAKGPACRPRLVRKDYGPFFSQHALNASYPGYKAPPGTQFYNSSQAY